MPGPLFRVRCKSFLKKKMGLFDIFRKKAKIKKRAHRRSSVSKTKETIAKIIGDIENIQSQIGIIDVVLHKHNVEICEQTYIIKGHLKKFENLEQIVTNPPISPTKKVISPIKRPLIPHNLPQLNARKFDISTFSNQEQRILSVFFRNQGMALSYADLGRSLNKSPNTIKNQMRQINMKADLFSKHIDEGNRNRFKLKDGLKIEKYFNIN